MYLISPAAGDEFLSAVVPTGTLSDPVPPISAPSTVVVIHYALLKYNFTAESF